MKRLVTAAVITVLSWTGATAFEGRYAIKGSSTGGAHPYSGQALVRRNGDVFNVLWETTAGRYLGTGILTGSVLSIVFRDQAGAGPPGVAALSIANNRIGSGRWSTFGTNATGTEDWTLQPAP